MLNADDTTAEEVTNEARRLWQKYFELTKDLLKFSDQKDGELFMQLVDQREQLIEKIRMIIATRTNAKP